MNVRPCARALPVTLVLFLVACGWDGTPATGAVEGPWTSETETRGDTSIVRTLSGSVWGDTMILVPELSIGALESPPPLVFGRVAALDVGADGRIHVIDSQAGEVRVFSPSGEHLLSFGRFGEGPGEFGRPDHLRVLGDGRLVVRDQAGRFSVFSDDGEYLSGWPRNTGFVTNTPFFVDSLEHVLSPDLPDGLVVHDLAGSVIDTIPPPSLGYDPPSLVIELEGGRASYSVPFWPNEVWSMTQDGRPLVGVSDRYSFNLSKPDGTVVRIERVADPTPIHPEEAARAREQTIEAIHRNNDPTWQWDGPDLPDSKPFFWSLRSGSDGTIWVLRDLPAAEVPNPSWDPSNPDDAPETLWRSPAVVDVFEESGRYLGPVLIPPSLNWSFPFTVVNREWVVGSRVSEGGYPEVVRFRVTPRGGLDPAPQVGS